MLKAIFPYSLALAMLVVLTGCAGGMLPGKIISEKGRILDFQIEKARRAGNVTAYDPSNDERFSGQYVGMMETISGTITLGSNIGNATAFLKGDKGSALNCEMNIESSFSPHGIGTCKDQAGGAYRLQF